MKVRTNVVWLVGVLGVFGFAAAPSEAALPQAHPPGRVVDGVRIAWPSKHELANVAPGQRLSVGVRSNGRRARVSLVRVDASGHPIRNVARRTLRSGTFRATVPVGEGRRYALRLTVSARRFWSWIETRAASGTPVSQPTPTPPSGQPWCTGAMSAATLRLNTPVVQPGAILNYTIESAAGSCIGGTEGYALARRHDDGSWEQVPTGPWSTIYTEGVLAPGGSIARAAQIPLSASAGIYRITDSYKSILKTSTPSSPAIMSDISAEFSVQP